MISDMSIACIMTNTPQMRAQGGQHHAFLRAAKGHCGLAPNLLLPGTRSADGDHLGRGGTVVLLPRLLAHWARGTHYSSTGPLQSG